MPQLNNVEPKSIVDLLSKSEFFIPDYQRPYAWEKEECLTLWEDIFNFTIPYSNYQKFNRDDEYFLGPIVTFKNSDKKLEIIDGQQRLTTILLILRAFYSRFEKAKDEQTIDIRKTISKCIWKSDEFGHPIENQLKIDSQVATDNDKEEFLQILKEGKVNDKQTSKYAKNFKFFQEKIEEFATDYTSCFLYLPLRFLNNCILLPIEAESQDTALRIFSTLNDRGLPLSDADIFKAQFYKYYSDNGKKDEFIKRWKKLEDICNKAFANSKNEPMDEIFTRYMYFKRAQKKVKLSTTEALRKFFEKDSYSLLKNDECLTELEILADFWNSVSNQDEERFSYQVLKKLFVLNYAPNGMWAYFVSVYFLTYRDESNKLNDEKFYQFLDKTTAFVWAYALTNPGVNALRTPIYSEMINIIEKKEVNFSEFKFDENHFRNVFNNYDFNNQRPITKSMLTWWSFVNPKQDLPKLETVFEIEHIYARNRYEKDKSLSDPKYIESLGNKSILEKRINIRASDYRFSDKKLYYNGSEKKAGTFIAELLYLTENYNDFIENDIIRRYESILINFVNYLRNNDLLK